MDAIGKSLVLLRLLAMGALVKEDEQNAESEKINDQNKKTPKVSKGPEDSKDNKINSVF